MIPLASRLRIALLHFSAGKPAGLEALGGDETTSPRWPVLPGSGKRILKRRFQFAGSDIEMAGRIVWQAEASDDWHRELYSFRWLQDIVSVQNNKIASSFAREFINGFITEPEQVSGLAWEPEVAGERLAQWLYHRHFVLRGGSERFQKRFLRAILQHVTRLEKMARDAQGDELLGATKGLISAAVFLPSLKLDRRAIEDRIADAISDAVLPDGGHASRNPERLLNCLESLLELRRLLMIGHDEPSFLEDRIERLGIALRFFRHDDGRLALFNGALMGDEMLIGHAVERSDDGTPPPGRLPESGFFRLERGPLVMLIAGAGERPAPSDSSFEFSEGAERFVVNCGGYRGTSRMWAEAALAPAAHSTLSLELVEEAGDVEPAFHSFAQLGDLPPRAADKLLNDGAATIARTSRLVAIEGAAGLHEREVRMLHGAQQFHGTDIFRLSEAQSELLPRLRLCLRFHLHPDIRCQRLKDGTISLSSVSGTHWYFSNSFPKSAKVEESVYLGYYGKPQKTLQIAICTELTTKTTEFRWNFMRQNEYELT